MILRLRIRSWWSHAITAKQCWIDINCATFVSRKTEISFHVRNVRMRCFAQNAWKTICMTLSVAYQIRIILSFVRLQWWKMHSKMPTIWWLSSEILWKMADSKCHHRYWIRKQNIGRSLECGWIVSNVMSIWKNTIIGKSFIAYIAQSWLMAVCRHFFIPQLTSGSWFTWSTITSIWQKIAAIK